jgi:radical SAM superfamily enzyme YgiQ (UPF0313 family)
MLSIIKRAHQYGCTVVVGGPDPTSQPHLYQTADFLVHGEGEIGIPMFLEDLGKSCKSGEYKSDKRANMMEAMIPRFDLIRFKDYIQVGLQFSRGCPFNCEFCNIIELYGRIPRVKTPEQIIKELQTLYDLGHRGHIDFVDDNFIGDKKNAAIVLESIKDWSKARKHPFYFSTESSINLADDENLLQLMKDVDFRYIFIGLETPDEEILKFTNKKININRSVVNAVNKINSYGIIVNAGFIIGFDNETNHTAENMIRCIQDTGICMAMIGKLYALPDTQLSRRLKKQGRLFDENSILTDKSADVDQMTSGLNFITTRPRLDILRDYVKVIETTYDPKEYYRRITHTGVTLKPDYKYKPDFIKTLRTLKSFIKVNLKIGFNRTTGWLYWKMFLTIIFKNFKAIEASINLAAMYIHFNKQSKYIIERTKNEIKEIEKHEEKYSHIYIKEDGTSVRDKKSIMTSVN